MAWPRLQLYEDQAGYYRWRLRAGNGEIVAQSEAYGSVASARRGARDMVRAAALAGMVSIQIAREIDSDTWPEIA